MESSYTKTGKNVYLSCREKASEYNERLLTREKAAELLGISTSTLANHELGVTKNVPPDTVVMMSDLYRTPELKRWYCKKECPIGKDLPIAVEVRSIEKATISMLRSLDEDVVRKIKRQLLEIAEDGMFTPDECIKFNEIKKEMEQLAEAISELRMLAEKHG